MIADTGIQEPFCARFVKHVCHFVLREKIEKQADVIKTKAAC